MTWYLLRMRRIWDHAHIFTPTAESACPQSQGLSRPQQTGNIFARFLAWYHHCTVTFGELSDQGGWEKADPATSCPRSFALCRQTCVRVSKEMASPGLTKESSSVTLKEGWLQKRGESAWRSVPEVSVAVRFVPNVRACRMCVCIVLLRRGQLSCSQRER